MPATIFFPLAKRNYQEWTTSDIVLLPEGYRKGITGRTVAVVKREGERAKKSKAKEARDMGKNLKRSRRESNDEDEAGEVE